MTTKTYEFTFTNLANLEDVTLYLPQDTEKFIDVYGKVVEQSNYFDLTTNELGLKYYYTLAECNLLAQLAISHPEVDISLLETLYIEEGEDIFENGILDDYLFFDKFDDDSKFVYQLIDKGILVDFSQTPFDFYLDYEAIGRDILISSSVIFADKGVAIKELHVPKFISDMQRVCLGVA